MTTPLPADATGVDALRQHWGRHSPRVLDAVYVGCGLLYTLFILVVMSSRQQPLLTLPWFVAINVALAFAFVWRRRYPVLLVVLAVVGAVVATSDGLLALALFALAIRRRDRVLVLLSAVGVLAMSLSGVVNGNDPVAALFNSVFVLGTAVGLGAFVGARRDLVVSLRERAERAEAEQLMRADQARLSERARIAQEMHDVLAHKISLVALHAGGLEVRPDAGPAQVERAAGLIRTTAREALEGLRDVLGVLRDDTSGDGVALAPQPRLEDVPELVAASARAGVAVRLDSDLPPGATVPEVVGRTAYRVVQEALTNVHKHAVGTATTVTLAGRPGDVLHVRVRNLAAVGSELGGWDRGPALPGAGMGLLGLGERVRLAGGRFTAGPDGDGFVVHASLPWPS